MGKLNIAHHKSYHPYRRDNIERVKRDEEEAQEEGRIMLADAEARISLLRQRAGIDKKTSKREEEREEERKLLEAAGTGRRDYLDMTSSTAQLPTTGGHINFFQDVEKNELATTIKTTTAKQASSSSLSTDKGVALAPSEKDLNPWYSNRRKDGEDEVGGDENEDNNGKRLRETARKSVHDPLTSINHRLALKSNSANDNHHQDRFKHPRLPVSRHSTSANPSNSRLQANPLSNPPDPQAARLARESSERERALALIRRKKREMMGSETPSTVHGGVDEERGYGDIFNREEVAEARRERERDRRGERYWDDGRDRDRSWDGGHGRGWDRGREDGRRSSWSSSASSGTRSRAC